MLNSPLRLHSGRYDPLSPLVQPIRVDVLKHTHPSFRFAAFFVALLLVRSFAS